MTSFAKALFNRNPAAARDLRRHQLMTLRYGKTVTLAQFTPAYHGIEMDFGRRPAASVRACDTLCGSPACAHGCTLATGRR